MSEIKRVALNTLEPEKVNDKVNNLLCKTVRISVILPESNEDNCPEYNYKDQLANLKKKHKQIKGHNIVENGLDPFGEDDEDVRRIALEMEAKYGSSVTDKKKKKGRKDDYADIGMGYDESDSFIDNTDGYDEIIPQNVTTLHGGFYINCGALEFKTDDEASSQICSSSSDNDDNEGNKCNHRKRILESSDDNETKTAPQAQKKLKVQSDKNTMQQAIKQKLFSQSKIQIKKRRPIDPLKKTVKELLREKREDLDMSIPPELERQDILEKDSLKENKKPMSISSVTDAIETVVKQIVEKAYDNNQNTQTEDVMKSSETPTSKNNLDPPVLTLEGESSQDQTEKREMVKLPENIPTDIMDIVNKIKQAALDYRDEGKKKFFSEEVNSHLLNLERICKILGKSSRLKVYDYLSYFCKVRKETLIRRAKILMLESEEIRLEKSTNRLKDCISSILPTLIEEFEKDNQITIAKKLSADRQSEDNKNLKLPRRRFQWTEEAKKSLKDIMSAKKKCLLLEGKQKDNLEELMVTFMRTSLLPLWPEGWMYLNNLKKVYNSMTDTSKILSKSINNPGTDQIKIKLNTDTSTDSISPKHSSLTITPIEVKTYPSKTEVPNSVTVIKVQNESPPSKNNCSDKIDDHAKVPSPHLMMKIYGEISQRKSEEVKTNTSLQSSLPLERGKLDKDYTRTNIINLSTSPRSKSPLLQPWQDSFKQTEVIKLNISTDSNNLPSELYGSIKEQSIPADCSLKQSTNNEEKNDYLVNSKSAWLNKEDASDKSDIMKFSQTLESGSSSKQIVSSKHFKSDDKSKSFSLSVNDMLPTKDKHSDNQKYHHSVSKHYQESSKQHAPTNSSKHNSEGSEHHFNSFSQYSDSSKHHSNSSKYPSNSSKHQNNNSKYQSNNARHHSSALRQSKSNDSIKLSSDNNVVVLNAPQNKDNMETTDLKNMPNAATAKSIQCPITETSEVVTKSRIDEVKYRSSFTSAKDPTGEITSKSNFLSSTPNKLLRSEGDNDIQMVMENLKALQKLSCSPVKSDTSSPVSVIAFNKKKSFKSNNSASHQRTEEGNSTKNVDISQGFQEDFQKQFINSIHMSTNPNTANGNYRCS